MKWIIQSLSTTAGSLAKSPITLSDGLNCIIGARGTCKSTIVEMLRFAFDCDPARVEILTADQSARPLDNVSSTSRGLIRASLKDGMAKCLIVEKESETTVSVERMIGADPRFFREGVKEVNDNQLLHSVEIYSQGDLQRIAEEEPRRLALIDRPNQAAVIELQLKRSGYAEKLRSLGPNIRHLKAALENQANKVRSLDAYQNDLSQLQENRPELSAELSAERREFQDRSHLLNRLRDILSKRQTLVDDLIPLLSVDLPFRSLAEELEARPESEPKGLIKTLIEMADALDSARAAAHKLRAKDSSTPLQELQAFFESANVRYYELRKQEQEVNEVLKREDALKQEISALLAAQAELLSAQRQLEGLLGQRADLRRQIEVCGERLYDLRTSQVESINEVYGSSILLSLQQGSHSAKYRETLASLLEGSRIRNQDDVANELTKTIPPADLVDIVEAGDARRLAEALSRDLGQMTRVISYLMDNPRLYELEGIIFEDRLEITMFVSGEAKLLSQLSKGQMATALLPLILRPAPYPLIFDQPEDDLDNAFIYQHLVSAIRKLKHDRQLIFVTHNANVPVLGEAENIIVMQMKNSSEADEPFISSVEGSKDPILKLLEGGAEAFKRRQQSYQPLLDSTSLKA